jgi:hypothetical protein
MIGARDIIGAQNTIDADGDEQRRTEVLAVAAE